MTATAADPNRPLVERAISAKAFLPHHVLAIAAGIVLVVILFVLGWGVFAPAGILPLAGTIAWSWLVRRCTSYRLFPDRLEVESGILSRKIENVELFRVRDVGLRQGLYGRLANFGEVYFHSTDTTAPDMHLAGIDQPREFYQQVRALISESRAQSRTMIVEEGRVMQE